MKSKLFTALFLSLSLATSACGIAEAPVYATEASTFSALVDKAVASEKHLDTPEGQYHVLAHIVPPDTSKTHQADYFSVVGEVFPDGTFHPSHVEIVAEHWMLGGDGVWTIDQWLYSVSLDGKRVAFRGHNNIEERDNGTIINADPPMVPSEDEANEEYKEIIARFNAAA